MRTAAFFFGASLLAALAAWTAWHWPIDSAPRRAARLLVWLAAAALAVRAWSQTEPRAGLLGWDGRDWRWQTDPDAPTAVPPLVGDLHVRLDLERWLLLEFIPATSTDTPKHHIWFTPSRKALPVQWHALRCAVYSPRPASLVAPDDGHPTAEPPPHEQRS